MYISYKKMVALSLLSLSLLGCGGSSTSDGPGPGAGGGSGDPSDVDGTSYVPLLVLEVESEFSGYPEDNLFAGASQYPYISEYLINPVNSATLSPVTNATVNNFRVTIDDVEIDQQESFPTLQRVIGLSTFLRTALVFDISGSTSSIDIQALVDEAKSYVAAAQAHSNLAISQQEFAVWAFGQNVLELTAGFTSDPTVINNALDNVIANFNTAALGGSSNLHRAVVQAIGRYNCGCGTYVFGADGDNDLVDFAYSDGVFLSQLVLFSSGPDTYLEMSQELMVSAVQSQAFVKYTSASSNETTLLYKPVFYYVVGDGVTPGTTYQALADVSAATTNLTLTGGGYTFSSGLLQRQIEAINARVDMSNPYVYRYAFVPRIGDHTVIFDSRSSSFSYQLTQEYLGAGLNPAIGTPEEEADADPVNFPLTEISGPNGEYIANREINFSVAQTFTPVTRWTNGVYGPSDYSWSIAGGTGTTNANGTYTVNSIAGASATLTLTNILRGETFAIVVNN